MRRRVAVGAVLGYCMAVILFFVPPWRAHPFYVLFVFPASFASLTVDPSLFTVIAVLAPVNGAIYAAVVAGMSELLTRHE